MEPQPNGGIPAAADDSTVSYLADPSAIAADQLVGFFEGWPNPPSADTHLAILHGSSYVILALDGATVAGFITAVSDGVLSAYIPLLEVRADYRHRGIGTALVTRMLSQLSGLYMVDLICDPELHPFYSRIGFDQASGAIVRNYSHQAGRLRPASAGLPTSRQP